MNNMFAGPEVDLVNSLIEAKDQAQADAKKYAWWIGGVIVFTQVVWPILKAMAPRPTRRTGTAWGFHGPKTYKKMEWPK